MFQYINNNNNNNNNTIYIAPKKSEDLEALERYVFRFLVTVPYYLERIFESYILQRENDVLAIWRKACRSY